MHTRRINWLLFGIYAALAVGVFVGALISLPFRSIAYAPLRELILPAPEPILLNVLYSTEKRSWLEEIVPEFEASRPMLDGRPIQIELEGMGSREMYLAVLNEEKQPDLMSPASFLQISILQELSRSKYGTPLVDMNDKLNCASVVKTPLVLVAWVERADVLWGVSPDQDIWHRLHDALIAPDGWGAYGHPEWGYLKFGHTDPLRSNSGFMTILLITYDYFGKTSGLSSADILSNSEFQDWFLEFENTISEFEYSTGPLMQKTVVYGPSTFDMVAVYEATAIGQAENAVGRYGELRVFYPPATVWSDHPFCVLNAEWVEPEEAEAAQFFIEYLTSMEAQESALLNHGFRPVEDNIPLGQAGSPFSRYSANGFLEDLSTLPEVEVPPGDVLNTLLEFWARNVNR
jgi:hypothetical protein